MPTPEQIREQNQRRAERAALADRNDALAGVLAHRSIDEHDGSVRYIWSCPCGEWQTSGMEPPPGLWTGFIDLAMDEVMHHARSCDTLAVLAGLAGVQVIQ